MSDMPGFKRPFESNSSSEPPSSKPAKTVRLNIDLNSVNRDGSVILNYIKLLNEEKARRARGDHSDLDSKKLKLIDTRYQSYAELGAGYDDEDSFIDNTDAYEEGLPENMDTKFGGYYINSGELELKKTFSRQETSSSSESSESSDSDSSSEEDQKKEPVKKDHDSSDSKKPNSDCDGKKKVKTTHTKDNKMNSHYVFGTTCKDD